MVDTLIVRAVKKLAIAVFALSILYAPLTAQAQELNEAPVTIQATLNESETVFTLTADNTTDAVSFTVTDSLGRNKVYKTAEPVISEDGEADPQKLTATGSVSEFKETGTYQVTARTTEGDVVGTDSFSVSEPKGDLDTVRINKRKGTFTCKGTDIKSPSGIKKVEVKVKKGARVKKTCSAQKQKDGSFTTDVNVNGDFGHYQTEMVVTTGNGIKKKVDTDAASINKMPACKVSGKKVTVTKLNGDSKTAALKKKTVYVKKSSYLKKEPVYGKTKKVKKGTKLTRIAKIDNYSVVKQDGKYHFIESGYLSTEMPALYTPKQFKNKGVIKFNDFKWTYYSSRILPGQRLKIPGRHTDKNGYIRDKDGYLVLASNKHRLKKGTVIQTPFGMKGKIYDRGCAYGVLDVYVSW